MTNLDTYKNFIKKENAFVLKVERDFSVNPKVFPEDRYLSFFIRIFIDVDVSKINKEIYSFDDIKFVKYELHPTYKNPSRISEDFTHKFEIKVWAYGFYSIQALIYPKFGPTFSLDGFVSFPVYDQDKALYDLYKIKDDELLSPE